MSDSAAQEAGVDPIWERLARGKPTSEDAAHLLLLGGIPGVCGPGRTAQERATIMNHNRDRVEVANHLSLATTTSHSRLGQTLLTDVASSDEELMACFTRAFHPSRDWSCFGLEGILLYMLSFAAHAGWMYFAMPSVSTRCEALPAVLGEWLVSARNWLDAPDWMLWMSFCTSGVRMLNLSSVLLEHAGRTQMRSIGVGATMFFALLLVLVWDIIVVLYLKRTDTSVNNWGSDAVGHRVGTFFLVCAGMWVTMGMIF